MTWEKKQRKKKKLPGAVGKEKWELLLNVYRVSVWGDQKFWK